MQESTGKIFENPTKQDILNLQLIGLTNEEFKLVRDLPEALRPMVLAEFRYVKSRNDLGRSKISIQERNAFRLGYEAGRKSMSTGEE